MNYGSQYMHIVLRINYLNVSPVEFKKTLHCKVLVIVVRKYLNCVRFPNDLVVDNGKGLEDKIIASSTEGFHLHILRCRLFTSTYSGKYPTQ